MVCICKIPSKIRIKGDFGEKIAVMFLVKHGFTVITKNYLKKCGEIDIVVEKAGKIHFIEVKTMYSGIVSCETFLSKQKYHNFCLPEENICFSKIIKIIRTAELYMSENSLKDREVQFDAVSVVIGFEKKWFHIKYIENINII
jgi:putative endonuclease